MVEGSRLWFWYHALFSRWWAVVLALWSLFSHAATFRDNLLGSEGQKKLSAFLAILPLPHWGWKEWALGAFGIGIAAALEGGYRLWKKENLAKLEELAKNTMPDVVGVIEEVFIDIHATGGQTAETFCLLKVRVVNQRPPNATIRKASLTLRTDSVRYDLEGIPIPDCLVVDRLIPKPVGVKSVAREVQHENPSERQLLKIIDQEKLPRGEGKTGWLLFRFADVLLERDRAGAVCLLTLEDDFGKEHKIEGRPDRWSDMIRWLR